MNGEDTDIADMPPEALFPPQSQRDRLTELLTAELSAMQASMHEGRVAGASGHRRLAAELSRFNFTSPTELAELLPWVVRYLRDGVVQITHPRYFGLFNPAPGFPSILADHIAAAFNPQLAAAKTSPAAIAIEAHVIAQVAQRAGLRRGAPGISPMAARRRISPRCPARSPKSAPPTARPGRPLSAPRRRCMSRARRTRPGSRSRIRRVSAVRPCGL